MNKSQEEFIELAGEIARSQDAPISDIPPEEWEKLYRKINGIKGLFNERSWSELEDEFQEVRMCRADIHFKRYFKLRKRADELLTLMGGLF